MQDCLIVGGGVIGLSLAYELAGHGVKVRVIDRGEPGKEASWAGAGILPPANSQTAVHPLDQLRALSYELHPRWAERLRAESGIDTGYRRCGGIYLARSVGEAAALHGMRGLLEEEGVAVRLLTASELADLEPAFTHAVDTRQVKAACLLPDEAQLRNPDHLKALLACCERRGVAIRGGVEAERFEIAGDRLRAVITNSGRLEANSFCFASGAWTCLLLKQLNIPTGILPIRGQMVMFKCAQRLFTRVVNEGPRYMVPREDGRVLAGSTEEEVGFNKRTTSAAIAELTDFACDLLPQLRDAEVERTWAGLRPGSFDGFPYLGVVPGVHNAFVAAGHFRSGLFNSPGTAVVMSQLMRGERPQIDLTPFRIGRG